MIANIKKGPFRGVRMYLTSNSSAQSLFAGAFLLWQIQSMDKKKGVNRKEVFFHEEQL